MEGILWADGPDVHSMGGRPCFKAVYHMGERTVLEGIIWADGPDGHSMGGRPCFKAVYYMGERPWRVFYGRTKLHKCIFFLLSGPVVVNILDRSKLEHFL